MESYVTQRKVIFASFGKMEFFEIPYTNESETETELTIKIEDAQCGLSVIQTNNELQKLKQQGDWICTSSAPGVYQVKIGAKQTVNIPFKYQTFEFSE